MMRGVLTIVSLLAVVVFPWPIAAVLAVLASFFVPLLAVAAGLFADTLYFAPAAGKLPLFTLCGGLVTLLSLFVRSRLKASIIGE